MEKKNSIGLEIEKQKYAAQTEEVEDRVP